MGAVRAELLEVAALLEQAPRVDPDCIAELLRLLTSGFDSPLFNSEIHPSELKATLYFLRSRLADHPRDPGPREG
ncbi:MAG: hypothetical protein ACXVRW_10530 [Solirubrobacteraceae bacterium]